MELQDTKTITLRKPITVGEQTVTEITLREPTAEEIGRAQDKATNNTFATINLVAIVGGVSRAVAGKLSQRDFMEAANYLALFTEDSHKLAKRCCRSNQVLRLGSKRRLGRTRLPADVVV